MTEKVKRLDVMIGSRPDVLPVEREGQTFISVDPESVILAFGVCDNVLSGIVKTILLDSIQGRKTRIQRNETLIQLKETIERELEREVELDIREKWHDEIKPKSFSTLLREWVFSDHMSAKKETTERELLELLDDPEMKEIFKKSSGVEPPLSFEKFLQIWKEFKSKPKQPEKKEE